MEAAHLYAVDAPEPAEEPALTPRQHQVLALIAQGLSNEEIGATLGISPRTVRAHSDLLRMKLGVSRRRLPFAYRRLTGRDPLDLS